MKHLFPPSFLKRILVIVGILAITEVARADTGFGLIAKPWLGDTSIELDNATGVFYPAGHESDEQHHFQLNEFESDGRAKFAIPGVADNQKILHIGYDATYLDFASHGPLLPDRLLDTSVAVGSPFAKFNNNILAVSLGVGYAGNNPFAQRRAVYGKGDFIFAHDYGDKRYLLIGLDYDGNRAILPDVPLPGFAYSASSGDTLAYVVGFPFSSLEWRPVKPITVDLKYTLPYEIEGTVGYRPFRPIVLFGGYHQTVTGFHINDVPTRRRLFFQQQRLEVGVTWIPVENAEFTLAGGYAFDQRFDGGFDDRKLTKVTRVSDEPFVRVNATLRF